MRTINTIKIESRWIHSLIKTMVYKLGLLEEKKMGKYTQDIKDKAVELAKTGVALKTIQTELGPNPKAVMRYLAKAGIDYTALKNQLKESGEQKPAFRNQKEKIKNKKSNKKVAEENYEATIMEDE